MFRTRLKRTAAAAAAGLMLAGMFSLGTAVPAAAEDDMTIMGWPTGCTAQVQDWGGVASCSSHNGGSYQAVATCKDSNGNTFIANGAWRQTGWSRAFCPGSSHAVSANIWTSPTP
ncbi:hypothetical protein ACFQS3_00880 [Glycomyces mayteni]|uniref:Secreted protein n=1 Tax=Glycomyces mayteni TaxID=543887 RepID=A0ABW2D3Y6_9ACTN